MNVRTPDPCIYSLTGYPGTGKYTVAKELVRQLLALGHEARLVDNHTVSDPILRLVPIRDDTPVPVEVWDRVREVGRAVRTTIATISPPDWSFVFTNFVNHTPEDAAHYDRLAELAASAQLPVRPGPADGRGRRAPATHRATGAGGAATRSRILRFARARTTCATRCSDRRTNSSWSST